MSWLRGSPFGFLHEREQHEQRAAISELLHWLRETLVDEKKVLEGLIKYLERLYDGKEVKLYVRDRKAFLYNGLEAACGLCWDAWREEYRTTPRRPNPSQLPTSDPAQNRKIARQSGRLLALAERVIKDLIVRADNEANLRYRRERLETAIRIANGFVHNLATGDYEYSAHYRHPQAPKWLRLQAQCARAMALTWMDEARENEAHAKSRLQSFRLPTNMSGATWDQAQALGFHFAGPPQPGSPWQKLHLPLYWYLKRDHDDAESGHILDSRNRLRARVNFSEKHGAPSMTFARAFEIVELIEGDMVSLRLVNNSQGTVTSEKKVPVIDAQHERANMERHAEHFSRGRNPFVFD